jgi:hypothetical protein
MHVAHALTAYVARDSPIRFVPVPGKPAYREIGKSKTGDSPEQIRSAVHINHLPEFQR